MTFQGLLTLWSKVEPTRCDIEGNTVEFFVDGISYKCPLRENAWGDAWFYLLLAAVDSAINARGWQWCIMSQVPEDRSPHTTTYLAEVLTEKDFEWHGCNSSPERSHPAIVLLEVYLGKL